MRVRLNAGCTGNGKHSARRQPIVPIPPINRSPFIVRKFGKVLVRKGCFSFRESGMIVLANGTMQWSSIRDFTNSLSLFCTICLFSFSAIDSRPTSSAPPCSAPSPQGEGFVSAASRHSAFPPGSLYTLYRKLPFSPAKFPPPCRWKFHSFCAIIGILIGKRRGGGQTRPRALPTERVVNNNGTSIEGRRVLRRRFQ